MNEWGECVDLGTFKNYKCQKCWVISICLLLQTHFLPFSALLYASRSWLCQVILHLQSGFRWDSANGKHQWKMRTWSRKAGACPLLSPRFGAFSLTAAATHNRTQLQLRCCFFRAQVLTRLYYTIFPLCPLGPTGENGFSLLVFSGFPQISCLCLCSTHTL